VPCGHFFVCILWNDNLPHFRGWTPKTGHITLNFELGQDFCPMFLPTKFHCPMFNHSKSYHADKKANMVVKNRHYGMGRRTDTTYREYRTLFSFPAALPPSSLSWTAHGSSPRPLRRPCVWGTSWLCSRDTSRASSEATLHRTSHPLLTKYLQLDCWLASVDCWPHSYTSSQQPRHDFCQPVWITVIIRVRMIVWKSDSPIVDSIGQNNQPIWLR